MRRVEHLITRVRQPTDNDSVVTNAAGIQDEEIIESLNDAQSYLQQELEVINSEPFERESLLNVTANTEAVSLPSRVYLGQNVVLVEYSYSGQTRDYKPLRKIEIAARRTVTTAGHPCYYTLRNRQILLSPIPPTTITSGLRVEAVQALPRLDKRRAKVTARTVSGGAVTALTVDTTDYATYFPGASAFSSSSILVDDLFSVVDDAGNITARNIPISAINGSGVCTLGSYTPESTSETVAVGSYLVAGANSTTHCELPNACEPFLINWGKVQMYERDGRMDSAAKAADRLVVLEKSIKGAWNRITDDVNYIPVLNSDYLFA